MRKRQPKTYTRLDAPARAGLPRRALPAGELGGGAGPGRPGPRAAARGAFGMFSCARATNEMNYVAQKFARVVMGTNNVDSCNRTCHAPSVAGLSAAFGSGGGTSSYEEIEHTDLIVMWGSNARFAHPIFFQHVLKGIRNGARMYAVDPRRTSTAEWAESWLGLNVGTDIPMAHAIGREIIHAGLANEAFIERATTGFEEYKALVEPWTLSLAEKVTGVPAAAIRELAHAYARAERAQLCWTLGITEHHNGTDNVRALINLSLLTGHVGRYGSGLQPLRGQNNVQGGGDMGAIPNRLPGFQDILDAGHPAEVRVGLGHRHPAALRAEPDGDVRGDGGGRASRPSTASARTRPSRRRTASRPYGGCGQLDFLVVQDIFLTKTAELADVVLPATAGWAETDGTTTNSERRVQRVRKAVTPPGEAREDIDIICDLAARLGHDWKYADAEAVWNELQVALPRPPRDDVRTPGGAPGHPVAVPEHRDSSNRRYLHGRLWEPDPAAARSARALRDRAARPARGPHRRASTRSGSPPGGGSTPTTPVCRAVVTPRRCGAASSSSCARRTPSATGSWSARRSRSPRGAGR